MGVDIRHDKESHAEQEPDKEKKSFQFTPPRQRKVCGPTAELTRRRDFIQASPDQS
jgi:hypothetical protein